MTFLDTIFSTLYSTASVNDAKTLYHFTTMLNRRNVVKDVRKAYQACHSFVTDVMTGQILACAMKTSKYHLWMQGLCHCTSGEQHHS